MKRLMVITVLKWIAIIVLVYSLVKFLFGTDLLREIGKAATGAIGSTIGGALNYNLPSSSDPAVLKQYVDSTPYSQLSWMDLAGLWMNSLNPFRRLNQKSP